MLNIVIPMAGKGSRFASAGFKDPKPLIEVHGKPMIQVVVENLTPQAEHRFIFICQNEHIANYKLEEKLHSYAKNVEIIGIDGITDGQASSVLLAKNLINSDEPLMTANSDQYIDFDINNYLSYMENEVYDGLIMTMKSDDPKWSFAKTDSQGLVTETAEKKAISNDATVGIYNFKRGGDFVIAAGIVAQIRIKVSLPKVCRFHATRTVLGVPSPENQLRSAARMCSSTT